MSGALFKGGNRRSRGGFTLVEIMVVMVIVTILGILAVNIFKRYIKKARVSEAIAHLHDIKAKQEAYRGRYDRYANVCDVTGACTSYFYPTSILQDRKSVWDPAAAGFFPGFVQLGFDKKENLFFQYGTVSDGLNPGGVSAPTVLGLSAGTSWFCVSARARIDSNSAEDLYLELTSHTDKTWQIGLGINTGTAIPAAAPCNCAVVNASFTTCP